MKKNKKAISPIIATVLLVAIVVAIALIVFVWMEGLMGESITKFSGRNIQLVCGDVQFDASYSDASNRILVTNIGNVPIYSMKIQYFGGGSHNTKDFKTDYEDWPSLGIFQGEAVDVDIGSDADGKDKVVLIPVLAGTSSEGVTKVHVCDEKHGYEIYLNY